MKPIKLKVGVRIKIVSDLWPKNPFLGYGDCNKDAIVIVKESDLPGPFHKNNMYPHIDCFRGYCALEWKPLPKQTIIV
jgi:hypothetical protein